MAEAGQTSTEQPPKDLLGFLDYYLVKKAPIQLPDNAKEWLVQYGPWITIVLLVLTLPALLVLLGLGAVLIPFAGPGYGTGFGIMAIGLIVHVALTVMALPGLFAQDVGLDAALLRAAGEHRRQPPGRRRGLGGGGRGDFALHPVSGPAAVQGVAPRR